MQMNWIKCQGNVWCNLHTVDLNHSHFNNLEGVYIIWHGGSNPKTVYVGQGNIRERLTQHRSNAQIQLYSGLGLFVTWASVSSLHRDGVERFLADNLHPLVGHVYPTAMPIQVIIPWA